MANRNSNKFFLKFTRENRVGIQSGVQWPEIGTWLEAKGPLRVCENGIHVTNLYHAMSWVNVEGYLCEVEGEYTWHGDKVLCRKARLVEKLDWNRDTARLFAADCAERVLGIFEKKYPNDNRPWLAIEAARSGAAHAATNAAHAATNAAYAAANAAHAATNAAYAAANAAHAATYAAHAATKAAHAAANAAYAAAANAAHAATYAANAAAKGARDATYATEREWQATKLGEYLGLIAA